MAGHGAVTHPTVPSPAAPPAGRTSHRIYPVILAVFVLVTRILCRGPLYFGDGPAMVASILAKTYVVQPPGYWLLDRVAGLFPNPVLAISILNIAFSVAGVVVFYYTACLFSSSRNALLASLAYSTIFYIWFSGEVHSSYASQIFFPVATYYALLRYERGRARWQICLAALAFAIGAGLRPTDGVFMLPMLFYFAIFRTPRRDGFLLLALSGLLCLGWVIPTWLAYRHAPGGVRGFTSYVAQVSILQSVLTGVRMYTVANFVRYSSTLLFGFWPVLGFACRNAWRERRDPRITAMWLWIVPGSLFFLFLLMSDATYLNYFSAAILLLALPAPRMMIVTAVWNSLLFLALGPVPSHSFPVNVMNSFILRYTRGGIEQRFNATLRQMQHLSPNQ